MLLGCGGLGRKLAQQLLTAGHRVVAIKRSAPPALVPGLDVIVADITLQSAMDKLPVDVDQVVVLLAPAQRNENAYRQLYHRGLQNVLGHFASAGVEPHWLLVSSTSVYAQCSGEWVDEDSPAQASCFNGRALLEAEQDLWAHSDKSTVLRFSGIYGPGRESLLRRVRDGVPVQDDPPYYTNRIHEADCVGILCFLIARRVAAKPLEKLYLASDSAPAPLAEVALWLSQTMDCRPPAKLGDSTHKNSNKRCSNRKLLALGYALRYPTYRQGYSELLGTA
ncbi:MAG: NAD(P)H-binding protein [Gammaproteobacteria bacterium]|nr:NAD(P)H-binding protein [Gammaproteobacteria bacterium]MBQ0841088.1 NAD(P)H-binding protein [Gammaproteobacteria bacterium]